MGAKTGIEWTDATWNPIIGCSRVSEGCRNCYAETIAGRFGAGKETVYSGLTQIVNSRAVWTGQIKETKTLLAPLSWRSPKRVFVNSMSDLFHENVTRKTLLDIAAVMVLAYWHTFQVLTKRPANMKLWSEVVEEATEIMCAIGERGGMADPRVFRALDMRRRDKIPWSSPLSNVWLGVSVENQAALDERIPLLLKTPAALRFISAEPLLGPIQFSDVTGRADCIQRLGKPAMGGIDWLICGGESGPGARPMHPDWARSLRDQCHAAGVPFFFKQWGEWLSSMQDGARDCSHPQELNCSDAQIRIGKKAAGSLLDGVEYKAFPDPCSLIPVPCAPAVR